MNEALSFNGKPVYYIDTEVALTDALSEIGTYTEIGIDTEFDKNRNSYGFNICVIQISTSKGIYIIDPIKICAKEKYISVFQPLFNIISSPYILKIIHACSEDIRLFAKYGCVTQNIFDTKIAAKVLGIAAADSYKGVLKEVLNIELDKSQQSINWLRRPLKPKDMTYLAGDVFYLHSLKNKLEPQLINTQRAHWFEEETHITLDFDKTTDFDYDMSNIKAKMDYRLLSEYNKALYECIWKFRGVYAKELNVPPFYIFTDENIYAFLEIKHWDISTPMHGIYKRLITTDKKRWIDFINDTHTQLKNRNLSIEPPEKKYMSHEEKVQHTRKLYLALKLFTPIQDYLTLQYGDTISRFLLSKTTIGKIASAGNMSPLPKYVVSEINKAAKATGAHLNEFQD